MGEGLRRKQLNGKSHECDIKIMWFVELREKNENNEDNTPKTRNLYYLGKTKVRFKGNNLSYSKTPCKLRPFKVNFNYKKYLSNGIG